MKEVNKMLLTDEQIQVHFANLADAQRKVEEAISAWSKVKDELLQAGFDLETDTSRMSYVFYVVKAGYSPVIWKKL